MASPVGHGLRATADVLKCKAELPVRARTRGNGANPIQPGFHALNLIGVTIGSTSGPGASPDGPIAPPYGHLLSDQPPMGDAQSPDTDDVTSPFPPKHGLGDCEMLCGRAVGPKEKAERRRCLQVLRHSVSAGSAGGLAMMLQVRRSPFESSSVAFPSSLSGWGRHVCTANVTAFR